MVTTITRTTTGVAVVSINCDEVDYYVDATGGDNGNDGRSPENAWKTIGKVNAESFVAGDHILFKCGETFAGKLVPPDSGELGNPIVFGSYDVGNRPIINGIAETGAFTNSSQSYLYFDGIDFSGSNGTDATYYMESVHDIYLYDCIIRDSGAIKTGCSMYDVYNITFDQCEFKDNFVNGVLIGDVISHDILFSYCTSHDNGDVVNGGHGFYLAGGAIADHCEAYNNYHAGFKMNDNEVEPFYYPITRYCKSHDNRYGLDVTHKNAIAHDNLIYDNTVYSVAIYGNAWGGYKIYFNTIVDCRSNVNRSLQFAIGTSPNSDIRNNLISQNHEIAGIKSIADSSSTMAQLVTAYNPQYNEYYWEDTSPATATLLYTTDADPTNNWSQWQAAGAEVDHGGDDSGLLTSIPQFVDYAGKDFHPSSGGNIDIHHGVAIAGYDTDMDGNPRADPPNCGCYEEESA